MAKNFAWIFSLIGGALSMFSLFFPASYDISSSMGTTFNDNYFMWGLRLVTWNGESDTVWIYEMKPEPWGAILGVCGLISTLLILISGLVLFITALTSRKSGYNGAWIAMGILLIVGTLFYIISYANVYGAMMGNEYDEWGKSWWDNYAPGFPVIAAFIGGGLAITGFIVGRVLGKGEVAIRPVSAAVPPPVPAPTPAPTPVEVSEGLRFCPDCGQKVTAESRYCINCGFDLKKT